MDTSNKVLDPIELAKPPFWYLYQPDPILYHSSIDNNDYILFIPDTGDDAPILLYKYDIINNKFIEWIKYPESYSAQQNIAQINTNNNNLFIIDNEKSFELNLNTCKWHQINMNNVSFC